MKTSLMALLILTTATLSAQEWIAPPEFRNRLSPFEFTNQSREEGNRLFDINCASCHGNPGMDNYVTDLEPLPGDIISERHQSNSDGSLFYKISEGRNQMPGFRNVLSQTDMWNLISYIRSFNDDYQQIVAPPRRADAPDYSYIELLMALADNGAAVEVKATGYLDGQPQPVTGALMTLTTDRYFGRLIIDGEKETGDEGTAVFMLPEQLAGNSEGYINLTAKLTEEDLYGITTADSLIKAANPVTPVSLTAKRAMWNTVWKAPVWLLITFFTTLAAVWAFIIYAVLGIRDIWIAGKLEESDNVNPKNPIP